MPIAFNAATTGIRWDTTASTLTFSHTTAGADRLLVVGVVLNTSSDILTGITYGGVAMTFGAKAVMTASSPNEYLYVYYRIAPTLGANNVVVSCSGNIEIGSVATSYTGVVQTSSLDAAYATRTTAGDISRTATLPDSWGMAVVVGPDAGAVTGYTNREVIGNYVVMFDSNGPVPVGSNTLTFTTGGRQIACAAALFKGIPTDSGSPMLFGGGVTIA
jgi:hypothetical protein